VPPQISTSPVDEPYHEHVKRLETGLAPYAKRSLETSISPVFVDGAEIHAYFSDRWQDEAGRRKLENRTPLQLERDRILYSDSLRKQTEKYHVLYNGQRRIVRNYTTHTMRMAQVSRSIARGLKLNADFAEAIALGSKVGATPFVHAAKGAIAEWVQATIQRLDEGQVGRSDRRQPSATPQLKLDSGAATPAWITALQSADIAAKVQTFVPWAAGVDTNQPYTAGQQSYWLLCTNPFVVEARPNLFMPETMYGIWRHTRGVQPLPNSFHHHQEIKAASVGYNEILSGHATYEATVAQYADDVTWVIENLNDANSAALLNGQPSLYSTLTTILTEPPEALLRALANHDAGAIYTYFISDFVGHSEKVLVDIGQGAHDRMALRAGEKESFIGLSSDAEAQLQRLMDFLQKEVFTEPRVQNRFEMLKTVSKACVELLYKGDSSKILEDRAALEQWSPDIHRTATNLLDEPVHRVQLAVDIFASMSDQEIYDFVGIQAL
jgi:dGTP triphosphohydrolase